MCDLHTVVVPTASWGIEALTTTTILQVPHDGLQRVAFAFPAIALAFWRDTTADACLLAEWVTNVGRKDAQARLAHLICEMSMRLELAGVGTRHTFLLDVTQNQLADALGLTSAHVNRTLQGLKMRRLVTTCGREITICDWNALAALGEFNADYLQMEVPLEQAAA